LAACSTGAAEDDQQGVRDTRGPRHSSEAPAPTNGTSTRQPARGTWKIVASAPVGYKGTLAANKEYVLKPVGNLTGVFRRDLGSDRAITPLRAAPGFNLDGVLLDGHYLAWHEIEDAPTNLPEVRSYLMNLRSGTTTPLHEATGVLAPGLPPVWTMQHGRIAYSTQDRQATNCIAVLFISTKRSHTVHCTKRKNEGIGFPRLGPDTVTFNEWMSVASFRHHHSGYKSHTFTSQENVPPIQRSDKLWPRRRMGGTEPVHSGALKLLRFGSGQGRPPEPRARRHRNRVLVR
jgi:hypothetical protein